MNIFKRFMRFRKLERELRFIKAMNETLRNDKKRWANDYKILEAQKTDKEYELTEEFNKLQLRHKKMEGLVREQAEADEVYASLKIVFNRLNNKPKTDDRQWSALQQDALQRLQAVGMAQTRQGFSGQGLSGLGFGTLGGVIGSPTGWPYRGLG